MRQQPSQERRGPLRTFFINTSMPVGGAEVLQRNLIENFDPLVIAPSVVCLKDLGVLGETVAQRFPTYSHFLKNKWDLRVLTKLTRLFRQQQADAVITVGAGDKMFWGRIAARMAGVPVVCSALHSTGWPDGVGKLNRMLTAITDRFIAVAQHHAEYLRDVERFPSEKVAVIPNGVDTERFKPEPSARKSVRAELGLPASCPLVGIVAALRPEKNHPLLVRAAAKILVQFPEAHFIIVGEGPERALIETQIAELALQHRIHLLGNRSDTPRLLAALDLFTLCSLNEANPVSILEALSCAVPVVSTRVGSVHESVIPERTGLLVPVDDADSLAAAVVRLLRAPEKSRYFGAEGRKHVQATASLAAMVNGYQRLLTDVYQQKSGRMLPTPVVLDRQFKSEPSSTKNSTEISHEVCA